MIIIFLRYVPENVATRVGNSRNRVEGFRSAFIQTQRKYPLIKRKVFEKPCFSPTEAPMGTHIMPSVPSRFFQLTAQRSILHAK